MNMKYRETRDPETNPPAPEPTTFVNENAGIAGIQQDAVTFPPPAGKKNRCFRPMIVIGGAALCMGLGSCLFPYDDSSNHGSGYTSTYRPGFRVDSLPGGHRREMISGSTYYYHDGYYYRPSSGGYVVVDAPRGSRYYDDYNRRQRTYQTGRTYQDPSSRPDGRYERTEVITRLPDGYREVNYRGDTLYQAGDRYYRRQGDSYVITTRPY